MFSDDHAALLQEVSNRCTQTSVLAERLSLPESLVIHLLNELSEAEFVKIVRSFPPDCAGQKIISDLVLLDKGQAAIEAPNHFLGKPMTNDKSYNWYGDRVAGDKFTGDKVMGNKIMGNNVQIGTVQGDAIAGNKVIHSQNLAQAAQDIKALLDQLAVDYDTTKPSGKMKLSTRILEALESDVSMKKRFLNALKEGGTTALEAAIDHPLAKPVVAALKGFMEAEN